jgi:hypothetical protein
MVKKPEKKNRAQKLWRDGEREALQIHGRRERDRERNPSWLQQYLDHQLHSHPCVHTLFPLTFFTLIAGITTFHVVISLLLEAT